RWNRTHKCGQRVKYSLWDALTGLLINKRKSTLMKLLPLLLLMCAFSTAWAESSSGEYHALRLKPGQDLKAELTHFLKQNDVKACAVVTCVGSLTRANLRFANESQA